MFTDIYDSVTDDVINPSMFVMFQNASAYPLYILKSTPEVKREVITPQAISNIKSEIRIELRSAVRRKANQKDDDDI